MARTRKVIERKLTRTAQDPVTGEYVVTHLDAVQKAKQAVSRVLENELLKLTESADRYRVVSDLREELKALLPHTGGEGVVFGTEPQGGE